MFVTIFFMPIMKRMRKTLHISFHFTGSHVDMHGTILLVQLWAMDQTLQWRENDKIPLIFSFFVSQQDTRHDTLVQLRATLCRTVVTFLLELCSKPSPMKTDLRTKRQLHLPSIYKWFHLFLRTCQSRYSVNSKSWTSQPKYNTGKLLNASND